MGSGVGVNSDVGTSMVGGWSLAARFSTVGRAENIAVGVAAGSPEQATRAIRATAAAMIPRKTTNDLRPVFPLSILQPTPNFY